MSALFRTSSVRRSAAPILLPILLATAQTSVTHSAAAQSQTPRALLGARALSPMSATENVSLTLTLPLRNEAEATDLMRRQHDPHDPLYGKYLTTTEFISRFAPTAAQYEALASYYTAHGYRVTGTTPNRLFLDVAAPAVTVQSTFQVNLGHYQQPNGRVIFSPDREPRIPSVNGVPISGVLGLDNAVRLHTNNKVRPALPPSFLAPSYIGTGVGGGLSPSDIKTAYDMNALPQTGTGQTLALFELDGYNASDITAYKTQYGLPTPTLQNVLVDGVSGAPSTAGNGSLEVVLDIELMMALAPNADKIIVYEGPNSYNGVVHTYNQIAVDNIAKSVSTSWGIYELATPQSFKDSEAAIFVQMALQGQTMFAASGDAGAYDNGTSLSVDDPASNPLVTGVGGTSLALNGDGTYKSETNWNDPTETSRGSHGAGGGGGISSIWAKPYFQGALGLSSVARNVPDVSLCADSNTGYSVRWNGGWYVVGGTSAAAPLWSAFIGLVNQRRADSGLHTVGYLNPTLYQLAYGPTYINYFHDIQDGSTNLFYPATIGYDNSTGLGSFDGANMMAILASAPDAATNLTATAGDNQVSLAWLGAANATSFTIYRSTTDGGPYAYIDTTSTAGYVDVTAQNGTTYYYVVVAVNAGITSLSSNQASATPVSSVPALSNLTLTTNSLVGGARTTGTVTLTLPATAGGVTVSLSSSDTATAYTYATALVPEGASSATFPIAARYVSAAASATISATLDSVSKSATLNVTPAVSVTALSITPSSVLAGLRPVGSVTISDVAPAGGTVVLLTSSDPVSAVVFPVVVPAGTTTANFPIATKLVAAPTTVTITAALNGTTQTASLGITLPTVVTGITVAQSTLYVGNRGAGTVTISDAAPSGGLTVFLASSDPALFVYAAVAIPAGATSATFPMIARSTAVDVTATLKATLNGYSQSTTVTVKPTITVTGLSIAPNSVIGGARPVGTVTISSAAPAGGTVVLLTSSDTSAAQVFAVTVPAGATSANFPVATKYITTPATVTITAALNGTTQTANLDISAPVTITGVSIPFNVLDHYGNRTTGTVTLSGPAPAGGLTVAMTSSDPQLFVYSFVIPAGATSGTFPMVSRSTSDFLAVTVTASANGSSQSAQVELGR